ncbi:MAG: hypothetical protein ABJF01_26550 [bacterium]
MIEELQAGKPDYERMTANGLQETHRQLALIQAVVAPLGAMESVTFKGVGPAGPDIYTVKFERGVLEVSDLADGQREDRRRQLPNSLAVASRASAHGASAVNVPFTVE